MNLFLFSKPDRRRLSGWITARVFAFLVSYFSQQSGVVKFWLFTPL